MNRRGDDQRRSIDIEPQNANGDALWSDSGYGLLDHGDPAQLRLTDAFLRHLYRRPELVPVATSCASERALHRSLLDDPRESVPETRIDGLDDPDIRDNYRVALAFRDLLCRHDNLETAYITLVSGTTNKGPAAAFNDLLCQLIVQHILGTGRDPYLYRAAELLFRSQQAATAGGLVLADSEILVQRREAAAIPVLQRLIREAQGASPHKVDAVEILRQNTSHRYFDPSMRFGFGLDLAINGPGMAAICRILEAWLDHFFAIETRVTPLRRIDEHHWTWHIGLDVESNDILNTLFHNQLLDQQSLSRLICLFRLDIATPGFLVPGVAGKPIYLGLAMDDQQLVKLKPQNLLVGLPVAASA